MRTTIIVGGGPGGTGPLVWAAQNGKLDAWLAAGVAILDRRPSMGGTIGRYVINSDSLGTAYLECLDAPAARDLFQPLRADPVTAELAPLRYALPPLSLVGRYQHRLGLLLQEIVSRHPASEFRPGVEARALHLRPNGSVAVEAAALEGGTFFLEAETAVMALGGRQDLASALSAEQMPGVRLADIELGKIMSSDGLLTADGLRRAGEMLVRSRNRRVVILGGSHSAFSVAWALTNRLPQRHFGPGDIVLLLRQDPPIFYENREAAAADSYPVSERDLCPRTKRVNRLGGLRGDGREVWRRLTRRPKTESEPRIASCSLEDPLLSPTELRRLLDEAALVVPAFGYHSATVPVFDRNGRRLALKADDGGPAVGRDARLLLSGGGSLANVFGIGLGADYKPWGAMGGEPSFEGQANSLWLYQNDIGAVVYQGIQECLAERELALLAPPRGRRGARVPTAPDSKSEWASTLSAPGRF